MNTGILLAIVATSAALTIMTTFIGVGIFSQHANAAVGGSNSNGALHDSGSDCDVGGPYHFVLTPSGHAHLICKTPSPPP